MNDIAIKALQEALTHCQQLAIAGQFTASLAHEIRNPLETIGNLAYLADRDADNPDQVRNYMALLEEQLRHITHLTQQTLGLYRSPDILEAVDLVLVAEAALRTHEHRIALKKIYLVKDTELGVLVRSHTGEMLQVVSNLIANAIDALPREGVLVVRVRKCPIEGHVMVADNGMGMPDKVMKHVFDPFFTTKGASGTGLGLAISKSIVEKHHGRLQVRSTDREGRSGTALRMSLPLNKSASSSPKPASH